jgi:ATP adenylyltransferase
MLNAYPYSNGHLMVAPYRHVADLADLTPDEAAGLWNEASACVELLQRTVAPHGFNLGMNLGRVAGAGFAGHLHLHVVPRWEGDTNFMPVLADIRVLPEALAETYRKLHAAL